MQNIELVLGTRFEWLPHAIPLFNFYWHFRIPKTLNSHAV